MDPLRIGRRELLRLGALGAAAAWLSWPTPSEAAGDVDALLLSCMDYRLVAATGRYMDKRGLKGKYDHVVLAGASLGAVTDKFPDWSKTFWQHLDVAIDLHHVQRVIVLDHRECGAYKVILGEDCCKSRAKESAAHAEQLKALRTQIHAKHPNLGVELLLMSLNGKVETIT